MNPYADKLWYVLETMPIPNFIFREGKLSLTESELAVYICLCSIADREHSNCEVQASVEELVQLTTYSPRQVKSALKGLRDKKFIGKMEEGPRAKGKFDSPDYVMTQPDREGRSLAQPRAADRRKDTSLRTALWSEKQDYLRAPEHLVKLLETLKGSPLSAYVAALHFASRLEEKEFDVALKEWRTLAAIARNETLLSAAEKLEHERVMDSRIDDGQRSHIARITLRNPETGQELDYEIVTTQAREEYERIGRREDADRPHTREQLLKWAASVFKVPVTPAGNDEWQTFCRCGGGKRRGQYGTLYPNGDKGKYGVFYCHNCGEGGTLLQLVMKQGKMGLIEALQRLVEVAHEQS